MPAAQGEVANREVRFTLRFRRTITIAARPVLSPFVTGQAATRRAMTGSSR
jgi:head-tail adaptor